MKRLRSRVRKGETLFGCFLNLGTPLAAEIVGQVGFDWVLVDLEHGAAGERELVRQLQALQDTPSAAVVRVESYDRARIHRAIDFGAEAIMAPRIDTAEQAQAVVDAVRSAPAGIRTVTAIDQPQENLLGMVQVESQLCLENLDTIAAIRGVDVLFVGPSDLSHSMGIPFDLYHPKFETALELVASAAQRHGKASGIKLADGEDVDRYLKLGYRLIACASDGDFVYQSANSFASKLRACIP